jgi:hypothetical protein
VVVSAALKPEGTQRTVVPLAMTKPARWYVSDAIVVEYAAVLARPELKIRKGLRLRYVSDAIVAEYAVVLARPEYSIPQERASATSVWEKSSPLNNNDSFLALARA